MGSQRGEIVFFLALSSALSISFGLSVWLQRRRVFINFSFAAALHAIARSSTAGQCAELRTRRRIQIALQTNHTDTDAGSGGQLTTVDQHWRCRSADAIHGGLIGFVRPLSVLASKLHLNCIYWLSICRTTRCISLEQAVRQKHKKSKVYSKSTRQFVRRKSMSRRRHATIILHRARCTTCCPTDSRTNRNSEVWA